ncbi:LysR family transcriptional regulator [Sphingomonas sp. HF-S3]|jgi:DNA-binding transcriptional LysR family regulator|uniref:LysR family transcriptional regulator n=1 Tax=Sphingomonas rustica TaxID=3103142 RepID=A0ABV0B7B4_9SPHN
MPRDRIDRASEMEVFAAIVERGSFSAAARLLGLTPSAISRVVARLESRLGVRLLSRTTRALALTPEGEAYHRSALRILRDIDETERSVADQAAPRGRLRVSATLGHSRKILIPLIPEFLDRYPGIQLDLSLTDTIIDLIEQRADVAIRIGPLSDSPLTARRLAESTRTIVASPAYLARHGVPQAPEDLLDHNCLGFNFRRVEPRWAFRRDDETFLLAVSGNIEVNSGDAMVQLVHAGLGIARVGTFHVAEDIAAGRLVALLEDYNPHDIESIHALFAGGATLPARVRVFIDYLAEKLR